jgi:hypothetical protein
LPMAAIETVTVWFQLLRGGENAGEVEQIENFSGNVAKLRDAVKMKLANKLRDVDANDLTVWTSADPEVKLLPFDDVPATTGRTPLLVHAPAIASGARAHPLPACNYIPLPLIAWSSFSRVT